MPREDDVNMGSQPAMSQANIFPLVVIKSFHMGLSSKGRVGDGEGSAKAMRGGRPWRVLVGFAYVGMRMVGRDI